MSDRPDTRAAAPGSSLRPILAIALLAALSNNAVRLMIPYRALDLGAGPAEVGLIASAFAVLSLVAALPIGRWVDRFGAGVFVVGGMALGAVTCLGLLVVDSLPALAVMSALLGLGQTINLVAAQAAVGNRGGRRGRDERYGTYATVVSVGQLGGPAIAGALASGTLGDLGLGGFPSGALAAVFVFGFLVDLIAIAVGLSLVRERRNAATSAAPEAEPAPRMWAAARRVLARPGMARAMLVSIIVISSLDILGTYLPVLGEERGLSVGFVGLLLSIRAGSGLVSRATISLLLRQLGRRRLLASGMAVAGLALLVLPLAGSDVALIVIMAVTGLGLGLVQPITISWVAGQTPRAERATALGLRITGNRAALLAVPAAMGALASATSVLLVFGVTAAFILLGAAASARATIGEPPDREPSAAAESAGAA